MDGDAAPVEVVTIETRSLGDRSYVAHDGAYAVVVDPQRDTDRVQSVISDRGLRLTHVVETHIHNDYVTGGYALARDSGAEYVVSADDRVRYQRRAVREGDVLDVGPALRMRVLHTPGHTFTHLAYVLETLGRPVGVFTGGSLLYGSTGRTDLLGAEHAEDLARSQYGSVRRLARDLAPATAIYPTHGFGSFCASTPGRGGDSSTLAAEATANPALTQAEDEFVRALLAGLDAYPAYYAWMGPANAAGPAAADLSPPAMAGPDELRRRIEAGEWVVDLRDRTAFAAGHLPGTLGFPHDDSFISYLGWLIPWGTPVTLLGSTAADVAAAQRDLARIGIDRPAAAATGGPPDWSGGGALADFPVASFADLAEALGSRRDPPVVVDVRRDAEWRDAHLLDALHIPIHELADRLNELPADRQVWVHCATGYRSVVAASMLERAGLERAGLDVVAVDDRFQAAAAAGLPVAESTVEPSHGSRD